MMWWIPFVKSSWFWVTYPMSMAISYMWVVHYIQLIWHDTWLTTHDVQLNSNRSWFSEANHDFWAHHSSTEIQYKSLKTMLCLIEPPRAAIQLVPKLQLTGFQVDFLEHMRGFNHWTSATIFMNQDKPSLQWKSVDHTNCQTMLTHESVMLKNNISIIESDWLAVVCISSGSNSQHKLRLT